MIRANKGEIEIEGSTPKLMMELYQIIRTLCETKEINKAVKVFLLDDIKEFNLLHTVDKLDKLNEKKDIKRLAMICLAQKVDVNNAYEEKLLNDIKKELLEDINQIPEKFKHSKISFELNRLLATIDNVLSKKQRQENDINDFELLLKKYF